MDSQRKPWRKHGTAEIFGRPYYTLDDGSDGYWWLFCVCLTWAQHTDWHAVRMPAERSADS